MSLLEDLKKLVAQTETDNIDSEAPPPNALARSCDARLLSALRGPDERRHVMRGHLIELKMLITARIRWIVFQERGYPGDMENNPMTAGNVTRINYLCQDLIDRSSSEEAEGRCRNTSPHFLSHLAGAVESSIDHPIWGSEEQAQQIQQALNRARRWEDDITY